MSDNVPEYVEPGEATTPLNSPSADRWKDIALKTGWTAVFTGFGLLTVYLADVPPAWALAATAVYNAVGAWLRQVAGQYAPPPAETVQSATVTAAVYKAR